MNIPYLAYTTNCVGYREALDNMLPIEISEVSLGRLMSLKQNIINDMFETLDYTDDDLSVLLEIKHYINEIKQTTKIHEDIALAEREIRNNYK